jgi:alpha-N-arabinofuranosidase
VHQDATLIPIEFNSNKYVIGDKSFDAVTVSASKNKNGKINITFVNADINNAQTIETALAGLKAKKIRGKVLSSSKVNDHNTFANPNLVAVKDFKGFKSNKDNLSITLPANSVVLIEIE